MKTAPVIIVQLIHIEGPLKGQIVELSDTEIKIGRHPSCQLKFPADMNIISREHAKIIREGNRFKLADQSANGTIVNGRRIKETFLKDGDVITISEGGPKVSFLTRMTDEPMASPEPEPQPVSQPLPEPEPPRENIIVHPPVQEPVIEPPQPAPVGPEPVVAPVPPPAPQKNKVPLIIQYGPTLRSFDKLPLKIGQHPSSDFLLEHANILDLHAEIYFENDHFWIRDLTGRQMITINNIPVEQGAILEKDGEIALSATGPYFQFLGNGRLTEVEKTPDTSHANDQESGMIGREKTNEKKGLSKPMSFLRKILSKD
ncbi:MAG: FHA domain-containing protein [Desulfobulbaceae bacterium]|nr:FHA domain-containing protein [Desulfobulbaceae bacterium]